MSVLSAHISAKLHGVPHPSPIHIQKQFQQQWTHTILGQSPTKTQHQLLELNNKPQPGCIFTIKFTEQDFSAIAVTTAPAMVIVVCIMAPHPPVSTKT